MSALTHLAYISGGIMAVLAISVGITLFSKRFRQRMKIAAELLRTVAIIGKKRPSVYAFSVLGDCLLSASDWPFL